MMKKICTTAAFAIIFTFSAEASSVPVYPTETVDSESYSSMVPEKIIPPFDFKRAIVLRKQGCINHVIWFRVKDGRERHDLLFSTKVSSGNPKIIKVGRRISGEYNGGKEYFCIESVLPLVVKPGALVDAIY
jgi:hypothetical protein